MTVRTTLQAPKISRFFCVVIFAFVICSHGSSQEYGALESLKKSVNSLRVQDGYRVRLIANEPLITDPVSARLDHLGRLWIVEMPDYPMRLPQQEKPLGNIKVLQDLDRDGFFESATLYADGLDFPTGVQPYRDGVFVTVAGRVLFIEDTDGDLVADRTEVWFEGFAEQNQQLRANHPTLAPDGMIYVANGLRGGLVQSQDARFAKKDKPVDLQEGDFYFDPNGGDWGVVSGKSQFGLTIDDFGRRIGCSNRNPAMHAMMNLEVSRRDSLVGPRDMVHDVALVGEQSAVYPRATAWTTSNLHSGQFSAACGVYAPGWSSHDLEHLLVCEPTAYLVQLQVLKKIGSSWSSRRVESNYDFLTSEDHTFRPVDLTSGPENSVFIIDMARVVIEHPDFMPPELKARPDQRYGKKLGRIWQVVEGEDWPASSAILTEANALQWLASDSVWQRSCASQYYLESGVSKAKEVQELLQSQSAPAPGKARAAYVLWRFGLFNQVHLMSLIESDDARLRALGIRLSANDQFGAEVWSAAIHDPSATVLFELALAISRDHRLDQSNRVELLTQISLNASADEWIQAVIGSVHRNDLQELARRLGREQKMNPKLLGYVLQRLAMTDPHESGVLIASILGKQESLALSEQQRLMLLLDWRQGLKRGRHSLADLIQSLDGRAREVVDLEFQRVHEAWIENHYDFASRADGLAMLIDVGKVSEEWLRSVTGDQQASDVRAVAIRRLLQTDSDWMRSYLGEHWLDLNASLRQAVVQACVSTDVDSAWILTQLKKGKLPRNAIDPKMAQRLRNHRDTSISSQATELLSADRDRTRVITDYRDCLKLDGDAVRGKEVFLAQCSSCHRVDGVGTNVGPDISDTRTKTAEYLLVSILDPNSAIDASFVQTQVLTVDGRQLDGLLISERSDSLTIQQQGGERKLVYKEEVERIKTTGVSLMPNGFEKTISPQQMSDLIAFLKNWRYVGADIPGVGLLQKE